MQDYSKNIAYSSWIRKPGLFLGGRSSSRNLRKLPSSVRTPSYSHGI